MIETFPPARYQDYGSNVAPAPELSSGPQIQVITVGSGGQANLSFTAIPQTFSAIEVLIAGRMTGSVTFNSLYMTINGDTTAANYDSSQNSYASGSTTTAAAIAATTSGMHVGYVVGVNGNANAVSDLRVLIPGYAQSVLHKAVQAQYNGLANTRHSGIAGGVWLSTAAITQLDFPAPSGSWAEGTVAVLTGR